MAQGVLEMWPFRRKTIEGATREWWISILGAREHVLRHPEVFDLPLERQLRPYLGQASEPPVPFSAIEGFWIDAVERSRRAYGSPSFMTCWVDAACIAGSVVVLSMLASWEKREPLLGRPGQACSVEGFLRATSVGASELGRRYYADRAPGDVIGLEPGDFVARAGTYIHPFGGEASRWIASKIRETEASGGRAATPYYALIAMHTAMWLLDVTVLSSDTIDDGLRVRLARGGSLAINDLAAWPSTELTINGVLLAYFQPRLQWLLSK